MLFRSLGELQVTWIGAKDGDIEVSDEFDRPAMQGEAVAESGDA